MPLEPKSLDFTLGGENSSWLAPTPLRAGVLGSGPVCPLTISEARLLGARSTVDARSRSGPSWRSSISPGGDAAGGEPSTPWLGKSKDDADDTDQSTPQELWKRPCSELSIRVESNSSALDHLQLQDQFSALQHAARIEIAELRQRLQEAHGVLAETRAEQTLSLATGATSRNDCSKSQLELTPLEFVLRRWHDSRRKYHLLQCFSRWSRSAALGSLKLQFLDQGRVQHEGFAVQFTRAHPISAMSQPRDRISQEILDRIWRRLLCDIFSAFRTQAAATVANRRWHQHCMRVVVETELDWRCRLSIQQTWCAWIQHVRLAREVLHLRTQVEEMHAFIDQSQKQTSYNCKLQRWRCARVLIATFERLELSSRDLRVAFDGWRGLQVEQCRFSLALEAASAQTVSDISRCRSIALLRTLNLRALVYKAFRSFVEWHAFLQKASDLTCSRIKGSLSLCEAWVSWRSLLSEKRYRIGETCSCRGLAILCNALDHDLVSKAFYSLVHWRRYLHNLSSRPHSPDHGSWMMLLQTFNAWRHELFANFRSQIRQCSTAARSSLDACRAVVCQGVEVRARSAAEVICVLCFLKWQQHCSSYVSQERLWQWLRGDRELLRRSFSCWNSARSWQHGWLHSRRVHAWSRMLQMILLVNLRRTFGDYQCKRIRYRLTVMSCHQVFSAWLCIIKQAKRHEAEILFRSKYTRWANLAISSADLRRNFCMWRRCSLLPWRSVIEHAARCDYNRNAHLVLRSIFIRWRGFSFRRKLFDPLAIRSKELHANLASDWLAPAKQVHKVPAWDSGLIGAPFTHAQRQASAVPFSWIWGEYSSSVALRCIGLWRHICMERRVDKALLRCKRLSVQLISVQRATEAIALFNERVVLIAVLELWWELVLQRLVGSINVSAHVEARRTLVAES